MSKTKEHLELEKAVEAKRGLKDERSYRAKRRDDLLHQKRQIGRKNIDDPAVMKEAGDIELGLTLVNARLTELHVPNEEFDKIDALHRAAGDAYNASVRALQAAAFDEMIASQVKYFGGDEKACRKYFKRVRPPHPMLFVYGKAIHHHPSGERERRDVIAEAISFFAKQAKYQKIIGL